MIRALKQGLTVGVGLALLCSTYVLILQVFMGAPAFEDVGVGPTTLVLFYVVGGPLCGLIYGLMTPLRQRRSGVILTGMVIAFFMTSGSAFMIPAADVREPSTWVLVVLISLFFGWAGADLILDEGAGK